MVVCEPQSSVTPEELTAHLASQVPRWWLPSRYEFAETIPRTAVGKIRKAELRASYAED